MKAKGGLTYYKVDDINILLQLYCVHTEVFFFFMSNAYWVIWALVAVGLDLDFMFDEISNTEYNTIYSEFTNLTRSN